MLNEVLKQNIWSSDEAKGYWTIYIITRSYYRKENAADMSS